MIPRAVVVKSDAGAGVLESSGTISDAGSNSVLAVPPLWQTTAENAPFVVAVT